MNRIIAADLYRHGQLKGTKGLLRGLMIPGFRYIYLLRKIAIAPRYSPARLFYIWLKRHYAYKFGYQIPATTKIGEGFYIGHFGTVVINGEARIGKNCNVAHNVTIGQANRGKLKGVPVIGDNVWIGTGAVVVGKITIGSHVLIAPNAYVNVDIPDHSIAIGNPCKIIPRENPCEDYIINKLD